MLPGCKKDSQNPGPVFQSFAFLKGPLQRSHGFLASNRISNYQNKTGFSSSFASRAFLDKGFSVGVEDDKKGSTRDCIQSGTKTFLKPHMPPLMLLLTVMSSDPAEPHQQLEARCPFMEVHITPHSLSVFNMSTGGF